MTSVLTISSGDGFPFFNPQTSLFGGVEGGCRGFPAQKDPKAKQPMPALLTDDSNVDPQANSLIPLP